MKRIVSCLFGTILLAYSIASSRAAPSRPPSPVPVNVETKPIYEATIDELRPTQFSIGYAEVEARAEKLADKGKKKLQKKIEEKTLPVVEGPGGKYYVIDHHHFALAMAEAHPDEPILVAVQRDWSDLTPTEFWKRMKKNQWCYLKDRNGVERDPKTLPKKLEDMTDDPYRSLMWFLQKNDLWEKEGKPFEEFYFAEYLRKKNKNKRIDPTDEKTWNWASNLIKKDRREIKKLMCLQSAFSKI